MRHILVAGGSRGIGAAIVNKFLEDSNKVTYLYKNAPGPTGKDIYPIKCDVSCLHDIIEAHNTIMTDGSDCAPDTIIYSAGISMTGLAYDFGYEEYRRIMDTNFGGFFQLVNLFLPYMIHNHSGSIIAISSMWGQTGASCEALYSATKGALDAYVKSLAKELGPSGIRVNCVSPGAVDTDMMASYNDEDKYGIINETPLMRLGTPNDIAEAVHFLASPKADFITGQIIGVNGGFLI